MAILALEFEIVLCNLCVGLQGQPHLLALFSGYLPRASASCSLKAPYITESSKRSGLCGVRENEGG